MSVSSMTGLEKGGLAIQGVLVYFRLFRLYRLLVGGGQESGEQIRIASERYEILIVLDVDR